MLEWTAWPPARWLGVQRAVQVQVDLDDSAVTGLGRLLERFAQLPDPRARRGRRHPLATLLVIVAAAVLAAPARSP
jgi:DDE_Tnp_1-associated